MFVFLRGFWHASRLGGGLCRGGLEGGFCVGFIFEDCTCLMCIYYVFFSFFVFINIILELAVESVDLVTLSLLPFIFSFE